MISLMKLRLSHRENDKANDDAAEMSDFEMTGQITKSCRVIISSRILCVTLVPVYIDGRI